jgi:putative glutathione S-transferase
MGLLVDGVWHDRGYDTRATGGAFVRSESQFRHWVTADGAPGPSGAGGFKAESGRYHLYVSYACPWAHRTLIYRALKRLEPHVSVSVVHWHMGAEGWTFAPGEGVVPDPVRGARCLHEIYTAADPAYSGRVTVPVLWDRARGAMVNNESSEIIRMFAAAFDALPGVARDIEFRPPALAAEIDALNDRVYRTVNNGVYRAGFAGAQAAYDEAVAALFDTLDALEARLGRTRFLFGARPTEADWRLFPTLVRFDPVYVLHFKCNKKRLVDYPHLWAYTRDLYQWPGVAPTVRLDHIKAHYFGSHRHLNPTGIVPLGPALDFAAPHGRA